MIASPNKNTHTDGYYTTITYSSGTASWLSSKDYYVAGTNSNNSWYVPAVSEYGLKTKIKNKPRRHYMPLNKFADKLKDILFFHKDWRFNKKFNSKITLISQNSKFLNEIKNFYSKEKIHSTMQIPIEDKVCFFLTDGMTVLEFVGFTSLKFQAFICKYNLKLQPTQVSGKEIPDWMKPNQEFYENYFKNII